MNILYWLAVVLYFCYGGWWSFRTGGDRTWGGVHVLLLFILVMIGIKLFPWGPLALGK